MSIIYWLIVGSVLYASLTAFCLFVLFLLFIVVMAMKLARDDGRLPANIVSFCEGFAEAGLVYDVICNLLFAWIVMGESPLPKEATVSGRLQRLVMGDPSAWRTKLAIWFAVLMNYFCKPDDPHIRLPATARK